MAGAKVVSVKGTVTRVFLTRGFGFIMGDDGEEYFLHADAMAGTEWEKVRGGMRVTFEPAKVVGAKGNGLRAMEVDLC